MLKTIIKFVQITKDIPINLLFFLTGIVFLFLGLFDVSTSNVELRSAIKYFPIIIGVSFLFLGLSFSLGFRSKKEKKIIFYSPTIKRNYFFHELLDHIVEIASKKDIQVIAKKGITTIDYHDVTDFKDVLRYYSNRDYKDTVIIMIPPTPRSYEEIFKLTNMKVNLITLDMEVDEYQNEYFKCNFLKKVIVLDNKKGCRLAAEEVIKYCKIYHIEAINMITCEGNFHDRGKHFREYIRVEGEKVNINVNYINILEKLNFSKAVTEAYHHVLQIVEARREDIENRATFIFCANDNMAIGAREALSKLESRVNLTNAKIVSFDASEIVRNYIDLEDKFIYCSVDQRYFEHAEKAVECAETIFNNKELDKDVYYVNPRIYKKK